MLARPLVVTVYVFKVFCFKNHFGCKILFDNNNNALLKCLNYINIDLYIL